MIPIEKKIGATDCSDFRTISLICHASKIVLEIYKKRITSKADEYLGEDQYGFHRGSGTGEAIAAMRITCERSFEHDQEVNICFVDFVVAIRTNEGETDFIEIGRGTRQGCPLSPVQFNLYDEAMIREAFDDLEEGIIIGGKLIKEIRFAADKGVLASTQEGLQKLMLSLDLVADLYGMKISIKKTKVMKVTTKVTTQKQTKLDITLKGQLLEQDESFKYLGGILDQTEKCDNEIIDKRIAMGKRSFNKRKILPIKNFNRELEKRIVKTTVWSVTLYACETWTLKQNNSKKLQAFEMWLWRKIEGIKW